MDMAGDLRLLAGRYQLGSVIGRGGMGTVWRARDELLDRDVAIKEIVWPPFLGEAEQRAARRHALREAQLAARLRHPNVVGIYDVVEEDARPWIVMELIRHRSLRDIVEQDGPLPPAQAAQLGLGVLAALRAAHAAGIVHLDVKPGNILVSPGERVVLTDFGIARAIGSSTVTSDLLIGSPSYIAPERARGRQAGPAADLWGLGAALYTAVEGHAPFERPDMLASLTAAVTDEPEPAIHAGPLWPAISGLLRKDPDRRLGPAEAERMLRRAMRDGGARPPASRAPGLVALGPGAVNPSPRAPGWQRWRSRRALGAVAAAIAMTTAASAAFALSPGDPPGRPVATYVAGPSASPSPGRPSHPSGGWASPQTPATARSGASRGGARDAKPPGHDRPASPAGLLTSESQGRPADAGQPAPQAKHGKHGHKPAQDTSE